MPYRKHQQAGRALDAQAHTFALAEDLTTTVLRMLFPQRKKTLALSVCDKRGQLEHPL